MLLAPRIPRPWWSESPISTIARRLHAKFKFSYVSRAKLPVVCENALQPLEDDCNEFLPWLERKAGVEISSFLSIGKSAYGRSLIASRSIQTGECILKVPFNVQISPENLSPEVRNSLGNEVGNLAKLAVLILHEQKIRQDSEWSPYICCLPQPGELHSTIFWSENELNMIRQSSVYQETISQKCQIKKEFLALKHALERFPDIFASINIEHFMHAYAIVGSRAWGSIKGLSLIPFADFLNHDGLSESVVLSDEHRQLSEVIADRDYAPGEEVLIRYGKFPNASLLLDFGFTIPHNIHDQVQIQISLPPDDPLREMKLDLMQKHCMPAGKPVNGFNSLEDSFTIKEVKSAIGKGKGLPQSLRAFSRVLCCSSTQELHALDREAAQCDGRLARHPFKTRGREILAHQILLSQITHFIEEHESSIELLGPADSSSRCGNFVLRSQMARDLLTGELRVLKSAYRWLKNYIGILITADCPNNDVSNYGIIPCRELVYAVDSCSKESMEIPIAE